MRPLTLFGFQDSVYTRVVRMALHAKGLAYTYTETNPFEPAGHAEVAQLHPFRRVPVLDCGDVRLYETTAILAYLDEACDGPLLMPHTPEARARIVQVQSIVDTYAFHPLVRQVFSHGVYLPHLGYEADQKVLIAGLKEAPVVLDALEHIARGGLVLTGASLTRADCHLAPMIDYFALYLEGRTMLTDRPALAAWFEAIAQRPSFTDTRPHFVDDLETPQ